MTERLKSQSNLRVNWLFDYTRASRGNINSRSSLLPLLKENEVSCKVLDLITFR